MLLKTNNESIRKLNIKLYLQTNDNEITTIPNLMGYHKKQFLEGSS